MIERKRKKESTEKGKTDRFKGQMVMTKVKKVTKILWVKMEVL